jgi:hypothetical protein
MNVVRGYFEFSRTSFAKLELSPIQLQVGIH